MFFLFMININLNKFDREVSIRFLEYTPVFLIILFFSLFLMLFNHSLLKHIISLSQRFKRIFKLTSRQRNLRHRNQSLRHLRMNNILTTQPSLFQYFLTLLIIILTKHELTQLIPYLHDLG